MNTPSPLTAFAVGLALLLSSGLASAQQGVVVQNFRVSPEFYPPPHEKQMKFLLEGLTARMVSTGRYLVTQAKLQNFSQEGKVEMVVEAPECYYAEKSRWIDSPGAIRVQTGNGGFSIEGMGFLWRQTNSTLLISNQVHTIIRPELFAANSDDPANKSGPIEIRSDSFEYGKDAGFALYRGNVRGTGTDLSLTGDLLSVELPTGERQVKTITAQHGVQIEYNGISAQGEKVEYSADSGMLRLWGDPSWRAQNREGGADTITIDRTNRVFRAEGNAYLRMLGEGAVSGFPSISGVTEIQGGDATDRTVEVRSTHYEVRTNLAVFGDQVHVVQKEGEKTRGEMSCDKMQLAFIGTNQLQSMLAEGRVIIREATNRFTAARAFFRAAQQDLTLTGQPAWEAGSRLGSGDLIRMDMAHNRLSVSGDARMRLPAGDLGAMRAFSNQKVESAAEKLASTNRFAEIFSHQYDLSSSNVLFTGEVRIVHPQMNWQCDKVSIALSGKGGAAERILAEPKVTFDAVNEKGQRISGAGDVAVYTRTVAGGVTNEIVELTGHPATLWATNGLVLANRVLVLDLATGKFVVPPGKYRILGPTNSIGTNVFKLLDLKLPSQERRRSK